MIFFNQKPGLFQSRPVIGWDYDYFGHPLRAHQSKEVHTKMIVDLVYTEPDAKKIKALITAYQGLFEGEDVIGPDGEPMVLGAFAKVAPVFPKGPAPLDVSVETEEKLLTPNDTVISKKSFVLKRVGCIAAALLAGVMLGSLL